MKKLVAATVIAFGMLGSAASTVSAASYSILFTEDANSGGGGSWSGTFETDATGLISSFSAVIDGMTFDVEYDLVGPTYTDVYAPKYISATNSIQGTGDDGQGVGSFGIVFESAYSDGVKGVSLFPSSHTTANFFGLYEYTCDATDCSIGASYFGPTGTYEISPVPIPAALPLLMSALGFFGFLGWRRKRLAAA